MASPVSTADEMILMMQVAEQHSDRILAVLKDQYGVMIADMMISMTGREVGAKRMRTLQRRGAKIRFSRYTATGKRRYKWVPASATFWI